MYYCSGRMVAALSLLIVLYC